MVGDAKWDALIAAISTNRQVIETDDVVRDDDVHRTKERVGYVALWEVDSVEIAPNVEVEGRSHLRFRFVRRIAG